MFQTAKHFLTACCTTSHSFSRSRSTDDGDEPENGMSEPAEDFSTFKKAVNESICHQKDQSNVDSDLYDSGFEGFDLPLRDPVHLLSSDCTSDSENGTYSAASETRQINWIYPTKRLLKGSVQYHVFYLGGTQCYSPSGQSIVNEVNRNIHSRKGLTFQRRVILRINASNIKIIDSYSENVKKSYLIDFVSFAAQDSNQGCIFSFITVDCSEYVCHSFLCSTVRHAERILMALGQAFEVAYQLRNSTITPPTEDETENYYTNTCNTKTLSRDSHFSTYSSSTLPNKNLLTASL